MCEAKDHPPDKESVPVRKKGEPVYKSNSLWYIQSVRDVLPTQGNLARVLASAAFPDGIPQVLGASVATHPAESPSPVDHTSAYPPVFPDPLAFRAANPPYISSRLPLQGWCGLSLF